MFCFTCVVWGRYGCQSHDLLVAKLNSYVLETLALRLISPTENSKREIKLIAIIAHRGAAKIYVKI